MPCKSAKVAVKNAQNETRWRTCTLVHVSFTTEHGTPPVCSETFKRGRPFRPRKALFFELKRPSRRRGDGGWGVLRREAAKNFLALFVEK